MANGTIAGVCIGESSVHGEDFIQGEKKEDTGEGPGTHSPGTNLAMRTTFIPSESDSCRTKSSSCKAPPLKDLLFCKLSHWFAIA